MLRGVKPDNERRPHSSLADPAPWAYVASLLGSESRRQSSISRRAWSRPCHQCTSRRSSRSRPLNDSMKALSTGRLGRMESSSATSFLSRAFCRSRSFGRASSFLVSARTSAASDRTWPGLRRTAELRHRHPRLRLVDGLPILLLREPTRAHRAPVPFPSMSHVVSEQENGKDIKPGNLTNRGRFGRC